jgi:hypothetical protein
MAAIGRRSSDGAYDEFGGHGPWRVTVLKHNGGVVSEHRCWRPSEAYAYARTLRQHWPEFVVKVRRLGQRQEVPA